MSEVVLTGLQGSNPIGFLASLGLLRICANRPKLGSVKLGWKEPTAPAAVLITDAECGPDQLIDELLAHMQGRHCFPLLYGRPVAGEMIGETEWNDVKVNPRLFAALLRTTRPHVSGCDRESIDFLAALGSECVTAQNKNEVKPTALHMTSGNQKFLETLRELAKSLDEPGHGKAAYSPAEAFREALLGEWHSADTFSSLGYDPATEAIYALTAAAPTDTGPRSTRAAVWLAVEALPAFPCFPVAGRLHTRGFNRTASCFRWPIWVRPLSFPAICTIVGFPGIFVDRPSAKVLRRYGITAVFEAERVTIGKGYGQFRPGMRIC